jgi:thiol-disulfide isomerase/thioredoxin
MQIAGVRLSKTAKHSERGDHMMKQVLLVTMMLSTVACRPRREMAGTESGLSDVSMALPANKSSDGAVLFDCYSLKIRTLSNTGACKQSELIQADVVSDQQVKLSGITLLQACDYELTVELGEGGRGSLTKTGTVKGNGFTINAGKAKYSNNVPGKAKPLTITSATLRSAGRKYVVPEISVFKINGSGPQDLKAGGEVDVTLDIQIGQSAPPTSETLDAQRFYLIKDAAHLQNTLSRYSMDRQRIFVQFGNSDCPDCKRQKEAVNKVVPTLTKDQRTVFVYFDGPDSATMSTYRLKNDPTSIVFHKGLEQARYERELTEAEIRTIATE